MEQTGFGLDGGVKEERLCEAAWRAARQTIVKSEGDEKIPKRKRDKNCSTVMGTVSLSHMHLYRALTRLSGPWGSCILRRAKVCLATPMRFCTANSRDGMKMECTIAV